MTDPLADPREPVPRSKRLKRLGLIGAGIAIIAGAVVVLWPVINRPDIQDLPPQPMPDVAKSADTAPSNDTLTIWPGEDGNYYLTVGINGKPILFRVMPYAGRTLLEPDDAKEAGIKPGDPYIYEDVLMSAGRPVADAKVATMRIGKETFKNVSVLVRSDPIDVSTLGRDILNRFKSWGKRDDLGDPVPFVIEY